jgi:hypothetical protein
MLVALSPLLCFEPDPGLFERKVVDFRMCGLHVVIIRLHHSLLSRVTSQRNHMVRKEQKAFPKRQCSG